MVASTSYVCLIMICFFFLCALNSNMVINDVEFGQIRANIVIVSKNFKS
jgi:hypothetical protein